MLSSFHPRNWWVALLGPPGTPLRNVLALLWLVPLLVTAFYVLFDQRLASEVDAAEAINEAGRQRMLAQRIASDVLWLAATDDPTRRELLRSDLLRVANRLEAIHEGFEHRYVGEGESRNLAAALRRVMNERPWELDRRLHDYVAAARRVAFEPATRLGMEHPDVRSVVEQSQGMLLWALDSAVTAHQKDTEQALARIRRVGLAVYLLALVLTVAVPLLLATQSRERFRAEQGMARLASVIDQLPDSVFIAEPDGRIVYVNPAFERITGYSREQVLGFTPRVLKSGEHGQQFYEQLWETVRSGNTWRRRHTNRRKDGTVYQADTTAAAVHNEDGSVAQLFCIQHDVTPQLWLEQQLQRAQRLEAIGTLAGGIAHDFNNLLTPIIGFTELTMSQLGADSGHYADLAVVRDAAYRAREMVSQILYFGRRRDGEHHELHLHALVKESLKLLRVSLPGGVRIEERLDRDVPPILGDPAQMHQMLMNLLMNAVQAIPQGGMVTVRLEYVETQNRASYLGEDISGHFVKLTVSDTGVGMSEETVAQIFEPFFSTKEPGEGTGLGLPTVLGIVQQHGGFIHVDSTPGAGTTFAVYMRARHHPGGKGTSGHREGVVSAATA